MELFDLLEDLSGWLSGWSFKLIDLLEDLSDWLLNLFRPKWKHSNIDVRVAAVKKITDQAIIADIAKNDEASYVRSTAVKKVTDPAIVADIARNERDYMVRLIAYENLTDMKILVRSTSGSWNVINPADKYSSHAA